MTYNVLACAVFVGGDDLLCDGRPENKEGEAGPLAL